ncbi:MAG: hypothetical protein VKO19_06415 [Cyanobacteriota bacterium]|jgi:hypothetical protein|nr:hypothetical protein [Cyanobacteriota bacterium]
MVTKVGHAHPMLICTDCGLPLDQRESAAAARQRLWGALTLVTMAFVSGSTLLLATIYENRRAGSLEGSLERSEEASGGEDKREKVDLLMEPSTLVKPADTRSRQGEGSPPRTSSQSVSPATQQKEEERHTAERQP